MDFEQKIARIHRKCRKMNAFESIARSGSVQNDVQKLLKHQNWRNRRWVRRSTLCYSTVTLRTVTLGTVTLGTVLNILEANVVYLDLCPSSSSYPSSNPCTFQKKYHLCRFRARARARARARSRLHFFATHLSIRSITHAAERRRHSNLVIINL